MTDTSGAGDPRSLPDSLALFDRYRDYIRHEDTNIHNRMTWFIQLNAFLILSLGTVTGAEITLLGGSSQNYAHVLRAFTLVTIFQTLCALTGMTSAVLALRAVRAANLAVSLLRDKGDRVLKSALMGDLPASLTGGGDRKHETQGASLVSAIPICMFLLWLIPGLGVTFTLFLALNDIGMLHLHPLPLRWLSWLRPLLPTP